MLMTPFHFCLIIPDPQHQFQFPLYQCVPRQLYWETVAQLPPED